MGWRKQPPTTREVRRKKDNQVSKMMTPEQYEGLRERVIQQEVQKEMDRIMDDISKYMVRAMRNNKISHERVMKICGEFSEMCKESYEINPPKGGN